MKISHDIKVGIAYNDFRWIEHVFFGIDAETPTKAFEMIVSSLYSFSSENIEIKHVWFISSESKNMEA